VTEFDQLVQAEREITDALIAVLKQELSDERLKRLERDKEIGALNYKVGYLETRLRQVDPQWVETFDECRCEGQGRCRVCGGTGIKVSSYMETTPR